MAEIHYESQLGRTGTVTLSTTTPTSGAWFALQAVNETVISSLTETGTTGSLAGVTIPAGVIIYGKFTDVTLTSGVVRLYVDEIPA